MLILASQALYKRLEKNRKPDILKGYPSRYGKFEKGGMGLRKKNVELSGVECRSKPLVSVDLGDSRGIPLYPKYPEFR